MEERKLEQNDNISKLFITVEKMYKRLEITEQLALLKFSNDEIHNISDLEEERTSEDDVRLKKIKKKDKEKRETKI